MGFFHSPRRMWVGERRRVKRVYYLIVDSMLRHEEASTFREALSIRKNWYKGRTTLESPEIQRVTVEMIYAPDGSILHWPSEILVAVAMGRKTPTSYTVCGKRTIHIATNKKQVSCLSCRKALKARSP